MDTFIIINGKQSTLISAKDMEEARDRAILYSDHSKEIIVSELTGIHNATEINIIPYNVTIFNQSNKNR